MRYLFHLKLFIQSVLREKKEKEKGKERKIKRKRKTKRKKKRNRKRKRKRNRERERKKEEEEGEQEDKEQNICKMFFFLLSAPGSALEKFAAIVNPESKPTKVKWTLSWPSALEICGKIVL